MLAEIEIDGKTFLPIKEVVSTSSYSRDYITKLARDKKIEATLVGRQWFVEVDSLQRYASLSATEQELRKHQLSAQRKREQKIHAALQEQRTQREKKVNSFHTHSLVAASFILGFGLLGGGLSYGLVNDYPLFQSVVTHKQIAVPAKAADAFALQKAVVETPSAPTPTPTPTPSVSEAVVPSDAESIRTITSLGNIEEGILLLPRVGTSTDLAMTAFSDNVEVRQSADGTEVIVQVDTNGQPIGNPIPFVRVPVANNEIPI